MRHARLAVLFLLAMALGACQSTAPSSGRAAAAAAAPAGSTRLQQIVAGGTLRVGLSGDQPPFNMTARDGRVIGFEVDIVEALGDAMGLEVQLVRMPFEELLPALEKGALDLVISGVTITAERNARVAFVGPYFVSGKSLLTRQAEIAEVGSFAALNVAGRTYVALAGSTSEALARAQLTRAKVVTTPDYEAGIEQVRAGRADALIADFGICQVTVWRHPEAGFLTLQTPLTAEPFGIALPPDDPLLVNLVENHLRTLDYTGVLSQLKARWLADSAWLAELP